MERIIPRRCCCYFSGRTGNLCSAVVMIILTALLIIKLAMVAAEVRREIDEGDFYEKNPFTYLVAGIFISFCVLLINIWLIYGVLREISYIVFAAFVTQVVFLVYALSAILVMVIMYRKVVTFGCWVCAIVFFFIFLVIMVYLTIVVFGHWKRLKEKEVIVTGSS